MEQEPAIGTIDQQMKKPAGDALQEKVAAIFDLDRTITRKDTFIPFLFIALKGRPYRIIHSLLLPIAVLIFKLGLRDNSWLKQVFLQAIVRGATKSQVQAWSEKLRGELLNNGVNLRALEQLDHHRQAGHHTILVSASFDFYVREIGDILGFDQVICTEAAWTKNSRLSGMSSAGNCYGSVKLQRLMEGFPSDRKPWRVVVYSDHHSDLPLLEWADQAVVVNPDRKTRQMARRRTFEVRLWR